MRAIGGGCAAEGHCYYSSARRLLVGIAPAAALPAPSPLDAQRAHLERALCATTAVLFVVSLSYIGLSTLFACLRAAGRQPPRPDAAAPVETTKRALEKIPVVVVVQVRDDPDGGPSREGSVDAGEEECAVCLAAYASGEELRVLPACRHRFHRACVDRWLLTRAPTCPVCRAPVVVAATVLLPIGT